jgi:hypothetical protein
LDTAIATVQAVAAASHERVVAIEAVSQQEQSTMAATATTTSGTATAPTDLATAFTVHQVRVATVEAEA